MNDVRKIVANLPTLERSKLVELWQANFGRPAPERIRRELMVPILAYRIQENAYGGIKTETLLQLRKLRQQFGGKPPRAIQAGRLKLGTRLIRRWRGQTYEVEVVEGGFRCRGTVSRSLSEIARRITGTQWSGPRFFGLNKNQKNVRS